MNKPMFVSLGEDDRLARLLSRVLPEARIISAHCLSSLGPLANDPELRILVDPRSVKPCCLKRIGRINHLLATSLGRNRRGVSVRKHRPVTAGQAWRQRGRLLSPDNHSETVCLFMACVKAHGRERYTVEEAAATLRLTTRHLYRLLIDETGCPPHLLLAIARLESVTQTLEGSTLSLRDIAMLHHFPDQSTMTRAFKQYLRTSPGAYRQKIRQRKVRNCTNDVRKRQWIFPRDERIDPAGRRS